MLDVCIYDCGRGKQAGQEYWSQPYIGCSTLIQMPRRPFFFLIIQVFELRPTNLWGRQPSLLVCLPDKFRVQLIHTQKPTSRIFVLSEIQTLALFLVPLSALPLHYTRRNRYKTIFKTMACIKHYKKLFSQIWES